MMLSTIIMAVIILLATYLWLYVSLYRSVEMRIYGEASSVWQIIKGLFKK
jgi:hypothetical protein